MTADRATRPTASFDPIPSRRAAAGLDRGRRGSIPGDATAVAVPVTTSGEVPAELGLSRAALVAAGFTGAVGQAMPLPGDAVPELVAVGVGDPASLTGAAVRDAAAAFARATYRHARIAAELPSLGLEDGAAAQAVTEGILLARYRYRGFRDQPGEVAPGARDPRRRRRPGRCGPRGRHAGPQHRGGRAHRPRPRQHPADAPHGAALRRARPGPRRGGRPRGRDVRQRRPRRDGLRRDPRGQRGLGGRGAPDQAHVHARPARRPGPSPSSARGSCTTPGASASSRRTRCTRR